MIGFRGGPEFLPLLRGLIIRRSPSSRALAPVPPPYIGHKVNPHRPGQVPVRIPRLGHRRPHRRPLVCGGIRPRPSLSEGGSRPDARRGRCHHHCPDGGGRRPAARIWLRRRHLPKPRAPDPRTQHRGVRPWLPDARRVGELRLGPGGRRPRRPCDRAMASERHGVPFHQVPRPKGHGTVGARGGSERRRLARTACNRRRHPGRRLAVSLPDPPCARSPFRRGAVAGAEDLTADLGRVRRTPPSPVRGLCAGRKGHFHERPGGGCVVFHRPCEHGPARDSRLPLSLPRRDAGLFVLQAGALPFVPLRAGHILPARHGPGLRPGRAQGGCWCRASV